MENVNVPQNSDTAPQAAAPQAVAAPTGWKKVKLAVKALELRLRFIVVLAATGLVIGYWDTLQNYWEKVTRPAETAALSPDSEYYCPMHPNIVRPTLDPGGKVPSCPLCGMPLSKRKKGEAPQLPPGITGRVQLSPQRVAMAGIQSVPVRSQPLVQELTTVGYVTFDEGRLSRITTRVGGYIEKLLVDRTWATVKQGEPLAEIYSPELYTSVQELLLASRRGAQELVRGARERLRLAGISDQEIDQLLRAGRGNDRLVIRSPRDGYISKKNIVLGASVEPGMTLFEVADLSQVWIEADVFANKAAMLHQGQEVAATVEALPGQEFRGRVALVYPTVETSTRTLRVRFTVENANQALRPGMFATVQIRTPIEELEPFKSRLAALREGPVAQDDASLVAFQEKCPVTGLKLGSMGEPVKRVVERQAIFLCCLGCDDELEAQPGRFLSKLAARDAILAVPELAVVDTGMKKIVYVEREPGLFEGVEVQLGPRSGEYYPVIEGLLPGDRVATAGSFLVDAETRLNPAAAAAYSGASGGPSSGSAAGHAGHSHGGATSHAASSAERPAAGASTAQLAASTGIKPEHRRNIEKLSPADQKRATAQAICPITEQPLGSMGKPDKIELKGQTVFLCCKGCRSRAEERADEVLAKLGKK